jgi:hypothetical protein
MCVWEFSTLGHEAPGEWTHTQHSSHDLVEKAIVCVAKQRAWAEERHKSGTSTTIHNTQQCRTWPHMKLLSRRRNNLSLLLQQWFSNKNGRPLLFLSPNECLRVREREKRKRRISWETETLGPNRSGGISKTDETHYSHIGSQGSESAQYFISYSANGSSRRSSYHRFLFFRLLPLDVYKFSGAYAQFFPCRTLSRHTDINVSSASGPFSWSSTALIWAKPGSVSVPSKEKWSRCGQLNPQCKHSPGKLMSLLFLRHRKTNSPLFALVLHWAEVFHLDLQISAFVTIRPRSTATSCIFIYWAAGWHLDYLHGESTTYIYALKIWSIHTQYTLILPCLH